MTGIVTNAATGQPVSGAWVVLISGGLSTSHRFPPPINSQEVFTDASGRFGLSVARGDDYSVSVGKTGYVTREAPIYGCPQQPGAPAYRYRPIRLMPAAVISGRVTDALGQPLSGAEVRAVKIVDTEAGPHASPGDEMDYVTTDDRGDFRIIGLNPGRYFLVVNYIPGLPHQYPLLSTTSRLNEQSSLKIAYPDSVLYPGTKQISRAQEIPLAPGQHMEGMNFRLVAQHTYQVSGTISGISRGKPGDRPRVGTSVCGNGYAGSPLPIGAVGSVGPNGQFLVRNVLPGCYDLSAGQLVAPPSSIRRLAHLRLEVRDHDIDGLHLTLKRLPDVPLKVVVEGPPVQQDMVVSLRGNDGYMVQEFKGRGGTQVIRQVPPGSYRVEVQSFVPMRNLYLKSARLGTQDILTKSVQILPGEDPGRLTVTLAQNGAELSGTLTGKDGKPGPAALVVLVPAPALRQVFCLYKSTTTNSSGRFAMQGIRPGSYTLFAWHHVQKWSWLDPSFIKRMAGYGIRLDLSPGERKTIHLQ